MRKFSFVAMGAALLALTACGGGSNATSATSASSSSASSPASGSATGSSTTLSLAAQIGQKAFVDQTLSGGRNMSCSSCHSPQYAYGPPNSLSVQLGSDPTKAGTRAVPSLRYKDATPPYADQAANPDGVTLAAAGGGFMWDGRAATLADQVGLPLLNPLEMNAASKAAVVQAVQSGTYAALFQQAFGATLADFAHMHRQVYLWEPVPGAKSSVPQAMALAALGGHEAGIEFTPEEYHRQFAFLFAADNASGSLISGRFSPGSALCKGARCA